MSKNIDIVPNWGIDNLFHKVGTKFRIRYNDIPSLYKNAEVVLDEREK